MKKTVDKKRGARAASLKKGLARVYAAIGAALIVAAIAMVVFGAMRGEAAVVLQRGIQICLECIGIG